MQITVYGASGKVGRLLVADLVAANHQVVAFVHHHNPFTEQSAVRVVRGSVDDSAAVSTAAAGSNVLISTLGSWGTPSKTVVSSGTSAIIAAAAEHHIDRVITLTGASALYAADKPTLMDRLTHSLLRLTAPQILQDGEAHLALLQASSLNWTVVRSPIMLSFGKASYRFTNQLPSLIATIPRRAVVAAIIDQLTNIDYYQRAPVVRRG